MKLIKIYSTVLPVICLLGVTASAQTASGRLMLAKGQKIQIDNNIKSVINQEMMGQSMEITIDANMVHKLEVKDKKTSSYLLSSTLTKLTTNGSAMGQEMKFDSDKKEDLESETGKALKDQLNVTREVELNDNAKVINAVKKEPKAPSTTPQLMDMVNNVTGGDADESNGANAAFEVVPAGKKAGDTWSDSTITSDIKTYRNYTLKEVNGNNGTVVLTGKQTTKKKMEQQGMEINVSMEAKLSGEGIVDMTTGLLKQRTMVMDGTGSAEVMGQSIPVTTKVTTTTTVKTI
ncbi:MAG: hypothetical protein H7211_06330 [Aquabacterium sp.]|nr:hypothetical protein [Ferruginibacter sp.]